MSTLNKMIADSIRRYPGLYRCRTDVLHQLFCVNGNGMVWENGILQANYDKQSLPTIEQHIAFYTDWMHRRLAEAEEANSPYDQARYRAMINREAANIRYTVENADDLALIPWSTTYDANRQDGFNPKSIYPLCIYACMNEVPDDVAAEWLSAVREMIFHVFLSQPNQPPVRRHTMEQAQKQHEHNINFADQVLQNLAKRFGDGGDPASYQAWRDNYVKRVAKGHQMLAGILKDTAQV